jgi:hypothetical protein
MSESLMLINSALMTRILPSASKTKVSASVLEHSGEYESGLDWLNELAAADDQPLNMMR